MPVFWRYEYGHEDWKEREDDDGGSSLGIQGREELAAFQPEFLLEKPLDILTEIEK